MEFLGNIFTHYNYQTTDIIQTTVSNQTTIQSFQSDFVFQFKEDENALLPTGSPFTNWQEARKYAGPLPFTFTFNKAGNEVLIIEGVRENWQPMPITVRYYQFGFIKRFNFQSAVLANAFIIKNIPYYWKKGKTDKWKQ